MALRPRVPKPTLFSDELTPTVLGGCRDGISRGGDVLAFFDSYVYKFKYDTHTGRSEHSARVQVGMRR